jgi:hypothetical protein
MGELRITNLEDDKWELTIKKNELLNLLMYLN